MLLNKLQILNYRFHMLPTGTIPDGTSCCPFVLGQKKILVPVSRCTGIRAGANVPGQTPLSRPVPGQNDLKIFKKRDQISRFRTSFFYFRTSFPGFLGTEEFVPGHLLLPLSRDIGIPGQENFFVPGRPVPWKH